MRKNRKKGWAVAFSAAVLALSITGCAGEPATAEGLMAGVEEIDPSLYSDMAIAVAVQAEQDGEQAGMAVQMGVESRGDVRHIYDAEAMIGASDDGMTIGMEGWVDLASGTTYTNLSYGGIGSGWTKSSEGTTGGAVDAAGAADSLPEIWDGAQFTLSEDQSSGDYAVEWDVDPTAMSEAAGTMGGAFDPDSFVSMSGTAVFSKRDRHLESIRVDASNDEGGQFLFYVVFHEVNTEKDLSIPQEVIDGAIDGDDPDAYMPKETASGWYTYDDGSEPYIDAVADSLMAAVKDSEDDWVLVNHYDSFSQAAYQHDGGGWTGAMDVQKATSDEYPDMAQDTYDAQSAWCREAYGEDNIVSDTDGSLLIIVGHKTLSYTAILPDQDAVIAVEITCDGEPGDDSTALGRLDWVLSAAGLPGRVME